MSAHHNANKQNVSKKSITFKEHWEAAKHLINVAVSVANRKELQIYLTEHTAIYKTFEVCKQVSIFVFPELWTQVHYRQKNYTPVHD
jgi:hypothetical protein